ncbi:MAG TPA: Mo-dependent nitrogenase C-terminal domain-containing protein [Trichocoleus sp.]|jgi:hypothetical protein
MFSFLQPNSSFDLLFPIRHWLDRVEVRDVAVAEFICKVVPADCPFARTITIGNHTIATIPPLCKLNPLYDQFIGLRFRSLIYLAEYCRDSCQQPS